MSAAEVLPVLLVVCKGLLAVVGVACLLSGIDDCFVDLCFVAMAYRRVPAPHVATEQELLGITEQPIAGIGEQARALNVQPVGAKSNGLWSLIYQGKGFVGTVTVAGPNASKKAVTELGQQAYAYANKTLS